jgi:hypothetical protein
VTHYIDVEVAMKLAVKAIRCRVDQSDLVNEVLARDVSSIVCFDRNEKPTRPADQSLTSGEIGSEAAA